MLMLVGCGGGDSTASSLSRAAFTKKVNQMCKKEKVERKQVEQATLKKLGVEPGDIATPAQQAKLAKAAVPPYERITEQIQELAPSDQEAIESLVQSREKVVEDVRSGGSSETSLASIYLANKSANDYGLKECSI
jgi:ubiquitin